MSRNTYGCTRRTRAAGPVKYYLADFRISQRFSADGENLLAVPIRGGDKIVPKFQTGQVTPCNPFPDDSDKRPSITEASIELKKIFSKLSPLKLRERLVMRRDGYFMNLLKDTHYLLLRVVQNLLSLSSLLPRLRPLSQCALDVSSPPACVHPQCTSADVVQCRRAKLYIRLNTRFHIRFRQHWLRRSQSDADGAEASVPVQAHDNNFFDDGFLLHSVYHLCVPCMYANFSLST